MRLGFYFAIHTISNKHISLCYGIEHQIDGADNNSEKKISGRNGWGGWQHGALCVWIYCVEDSEERGDCIVSHHDAEIVWNAADRHKKWTPNWHTNTCGALDSTQVNNNKAWCSGSILLSHHVAGQGSRWFLFLLWKNMLQFLVYWRREWHSRGGWRGGGSGAATVCLMKIWVVSVFDKLKTVSHLMQSTRI